MATPRAQDDRIATHPRGDVASTMAGSAYARPWRAVAAALVTATWIGMLAMAAALVLLETRLDNQLRLLRTFALVLAPRVAAWLLDRAFAATVTVEAGRLVVRRRDRQVDVPCDAIVAVEPWLLPLPSPGLELRLRSGRRLPYGISVDDPGALVDALADAGASASMRRVADAPAGAYAWASARRRWWSHPLVKFVAFALVPTIPLFRLHQWIAYGDTFGEYYSYGLGAYLLAFAVFWSAFVIYLALWAAVLRVAAEAAVALAAWRAPARAQAVRRTVETVAAVAYVGGLAAFLLRIAMLAG